MSSLKTRPMFDNERKRLSYALTMHQEGGLTALQLRSDMANKFHNFFITQHLKGKKAGIVGVHRLEARDVE